MMDHAENPSPAKMFDCKQIWRVDTTADVVSTITERLRAYFGSNRGVCATYGLVSFSTWATILFLRMGADVL